MRRLNNQQHFPEADALLSQLEKKYGKNHHNIQNARAHYYQDHAKQFYQKQGTINRDLLSKAISIWKQHAQGYTADIEPYPFVYQRAVAALCFAFSLLKNTKQVNLYRSLFFINLDGCRQRQIPITSSMRNAEQSLQQLYARPPVTLVSPVSSNNSSPHAILDMKRQLFHYLKTAQLNNNPELKHSVLQRISENGWAKEIPAQECMARDYQHLNQHRLAIPLFKQILTDLMSIQPPPTLYKIQHIMLALVISLAKDNTFTETVDTILHYKNQLRLWVGKGIGNERNLLRGLITLFNAEKRTGHFTFTQEELKQIANEENLTPLFNEIFYQRNSPS